MSHHYASLTHNDRAERHKRIVRRYAEGASSRQIAAEFGLSRGHVSLIASLYGVNRPVGRPRRGQA